MATSEQDHFVLLVRDGVRGRGGRGTPGRRLTEVLRDLIGADALSAGARLPSERELAKAVDMSRGTVAGVYRTLCAQGWCERRHGSGTYVREPVDAADGVRRIERLMRRDAGLIDLSKSVVPDASHLPVPALDVAELLRTPSGHGYDALGDSRLLAQLRRRTDADPLVTAGAQQGIALAARCVVRAGDVVLVDEAAYPGALAVFRRRGAQVVTVADDGGGMAPEAFREAVVRHRPACAYVLPVHNPTGRVVEPDRMAAIAVTAREHEVSLIEDRTLAEITFGSTAAPPCTTAHPDGTIVVDSLSKVLWGGLRIGWVTAAEPLLARLVELKHEADLATSVVGQRMAAAVLERADVDQWRQELARRRDRFTAALGERLPTWTWDVPDGGLSLWARLPRTDTDAFAEAARGHGVAVAPGSVFSPDGRQRDRLRLSFAPGDELLDEAVAALSRAWSGRQSAPAARPGGMDLTV
ncbi:GntR family transcriptional regulator [Haloactinopolyspora alba]|uniref:GntR family transcriptional regulator n=1 Tax=Haloactinopolyspora alba TaxID=648780 RepID=A0A2P8E7F8_9ACTN|nr:PLP-dependent aminotransferase family protein [Haloactinopolyspora alba]PSL05391.1 GntR family transcriptional regulator [Haloactinopolyspora alba]